MGFLSLWWLPILFSLPSPMVFFPVSDIPHRSESIWSLSFFHWLIPLSIIPSSSTQVGVMVSVHPFWWLSNIPLYIWTASSLSIHLSMVICTFPQFVYYGYCCYEHCGACVPSSLPLSLWGKYPVVQLLGHRVALFITFWGNSVPFSRVAVPDCIRTGV